MLEITSKQLSFKKYLIWTGLIILASILLIYFISLRNFSISKELQDKKSQIQVLKNREENINKLQEDYYKIENDIPTVTTILPDEENVVSFVSYLENLSSKHNTNIDLVFSDKLNSQIEQNQSLIFNLNISGSGETVREYWKALEHGSYFINVENFNLSTVDGLGSDTQLKLTAKVFTNKPFKIEK